MRQFMSVAGWLAACLALVAAGSATWLLGVAYGARHRPPEAWVGLVAVIAAFVLACTSAVIYRVDRVHERITDDAAEGEESRASLATQLGAELDEIRKEMRDTLGPLDRLGQYLALIGEAKEQQKEPSAGLQSVPRDRGASS